MVRQQLPLVYYYFLLSEHFLICYLLDVFYIGVTHDDSSFIIGERRRIINNPYIGDTCIIRFTIKNADVTIYFIPLIMLLL
jgi:hypothetical protein